MNIAYLSKTKKIILGIALFLLILSLILVFVIPKKSPIQNESLFPTPTPVKNSALLFPTILPTPHIVAAPNQRYTSLGTITYSLVNPSLPSSLPVYPVSSYGFSPQYAQTIATLLSFPPNTLLAQSSKTLSWKNTSNVEFLDIAPEQGYIEFRSDYSPEKPDGARSTFTKISSQEQILSIAQQFIRQKGLYEQSLSSTPSITPYKTSVEEPIKTAFSDADVFLVEYTREVEKRHVYTQHANNTYLSLWISSLGIIKKIVYQHLSLAPQPKHYSLPSFDAVKTRIQNGDASITRFGALEYGVFDPVSIQKTEFSEMEIAYMDDRKSGFLLPIVSFSGIATLLDGSKEQIRITLPLQ